MDVGVECEMFDWVVVGVKDIWVFVLVWVMVGCILC